MSDETPEPEEISENLQAFADIHSVLCWSAHYPHDHGYECHGTCPTCHGREYHPPRGSDD